VWNQHFKNILGINNLIIALSIYILVMVIGKMDYSERKIVDVAR